MCDVVYLPNGETVMSVGGLRAQDWEVRDSDFPDAMPDQVDVANLCFCCCDVEAVLTRAGVRFTYEGDYGGEWFVKSDG